jgi:tetratricopeptide (TPR) repeat protein
MIRAYLAGRLGGHEFSEEQVDTIAQFTRGLPLAVSLTATLLSQGQTVETVCREADRGHPGSVVSSLARRYLVHAERQQYETDDPRRDDVMKILGLALSYGDIRSDPELLAALWGASDPLASFAELSRRHDFVLPVSRRLHDDVRDTLRVDLLDPFRRNHVRPINQRALWLFNGRLTRLRSRWPTLDEQLAHSAYTTTVLSALWHTLWTDNQAGLDLLAEILPILAVTHPAAADAAAAITGQFEHTMDRGQCRDLDSLTQARPGTLGDERTATQLRTPARAARQANITLASLAFQPTQMAASTCAIGTPSDRQVSILILRAGIQAEDHDDESAIATLQEAAAQATSTRLQHAIGSRANTIASQLIWGSPSRTSVPDPLGLEAVELAIRTRPNLSSTWHAYAAALIRAARYKDALDACDQAITLSPSYATAHITRGTTLHNLGRDEDAQAAYEDALDVCDQAITLNPHNAAAHTTRGTTLRALDRYEDALDACDQAITLNPSYATAHTARAQKLRTMGRDD